MSSVKIINNQSEINLNNKWVPSTKFNSKDRIVDQNGHKIGSGYKGRQYRIIEKRERAFSGLERFGRGLLGTVAVICTLCFALFSKSVRNLFTKSKENIRFAILETPVNLPLKKDSEDLEKDKHVSKEKRVSLSSEISSESNKTTTDQRSPLVDHYPELTHAKEEILTWFGKEDSKLGKGEYNTLITKLSTLSKDIPKKKITLHCDYFRFGFSLFYVEKPGEEKYMPITRLEGIILNWQVKNTPDIILPLRDPQDNSYFIPEIVVEVVKGSHSGSESTGSYLCNLLNSASYSKNSYRILEGLIGYANEIQQEFGNSRYKNLRKMIANYPDLPDLEEKPFSLF